MVNDVTMWAILDGIAQAIHYFDSIPLFDVTLMGVHYSLSLLDAGIAYSVFASLLVTVLGVFGFDGAPETWDDDPSLWEDDD